MSAASVTGHVLNANPYTAAPVTFTLTAGGGFSGAISWSVTGLPSGVTATGVPATSTGKPTITLIGSSAAISGSYTAQIVGTYGTYESSVNLPITVAAT